MRILNEKQSWLQMSSLIQRFFLPGTAFAPLEMIVKVGLLAETAAAVRAGHFLTPVGRFYMARQVPSTR